MNLCGIFPPFLQRTCCRVDSALDQVVVLVHPLAIALEVDLCGRRGAAHQHHRLVLHYELVLRLHQEVRQQVGEGCREGGGGCSMLRAFFGDKRGRDRESDEISGGSIHWSNSQSSKRVTAIPDGVSSPLRALFGSDSITSSHGASSNDHLLRSTLLLSFYLIQGFCCITSFES